MDYYEILNLNKEPFSTSPDPAFLYRSTSHNVVLNRLEIAIRLRRGLNMILGDVGTGKTTLSRALLQNFRDEEDFIFHIVLSPSYRGERQFLAHLCKIFHIKVLGRSIMDHKDALERYLYQKGVEENKTIVLLIDEGQNLKPSLLELLRVLLNYETNEYKLLQLVIMAQMEILGNVTRMKNFMDRVAFKYILPPLSEEETRNMINYRLAQAGYIGKSPLFTDEAISEIYLNTRGYPRKITTLCHDAIERLVMIDKNSVDGSVIRDVVDRERGIFPIRRITRYENPVYRR